MEGSNEPLKISKGFSALGIFGHKVQQAIMPIFAVAGDDIVPLGTGFVISPDGLMMTAKHVLDEVCEKRLKKRDGSGEIYKNVELYAMYVTNAENKESPGDLIGGNWPIDRVWYMEGLDIAYCWLRQAIIDGEPFKFKAYPQLSPGLPKIGENILGFGYYKSEAAFTQEIKDGKRVVNYSQNTAFSTGIIEELYYPKRDSCLLTFPCFQTTARFDGGMSGGPIFNGSTGGVCGVICDSFGEPREDGEHTSYGSLIWPSLAMTLNLDDPNAENLTVYEAMERGFILADKTFTQLEYLKNGDSVSIGLKQ